MMEQRLSFITIGVHDLEKMKHFYMEKFGWAPLKELEGIVFFKLNGFILALFPSHELAKDAGITGEHNGFKRFSLAINMSSEAEVNEMFAKLSARGVNIIKAPEKVFWGGYSGYVEDAENNLWEIAYNPFLVLDEKGNVITHH
jgi:catechol 2,3-dioxygenase-like lactoylglutathione lyase family enzyme